MDDNINMSDWVAGLHYHWTKEREHAASRKELEEKIAAGLNFGEPGVAKTRTFQTADGVIKIKMSQSKSVKVDAEVWDSIDDGAASGCVKVSYDLRQREAKEFAARHPQRWSELEAALETKLGKISVKTEKVEEV